MPWIRKLTFISQRSFYSFTIVRAPYILFMHSEFIIRVDMKVQREVIEFEKKLNGKKRMENHPSGVAETELT